MKKELSPAEAQKLLKAYRNLAQATDHHFERAAYGHNDGIAGYQKARQKVAEIERQLA